MDNIDKIITQAIKEELTALPKEINGDKLLMLSMFAAGVRFNILRKLDEPVEERQQGWQCPLCKRVYSPFTPCCSSCGAEDKTKTSTDQNVLMGRLDIGGHVITYPLKG